MFLVRASSENYDFPDGKDPSGHFYLQCHFSLTRYIFCGIILYYKNLRFGRKEETSMSYNKDDFVRIKAEFSQKYIKARERATERRNELHGRFPRVWEIDRLLARTGMDIMGVIASGKNTEEQIAAIRERNDKLLAERGEILRSGGYPEDYSDVKYDCDKCGDTGYVGTRMCECMKRALVMAGYESSGLGALIKSQSFENFSLDYYVTGGGNAELMRLKAIYALRADGGSLNDAWGRLFSALRARAEHGRESR